MSSSVCELFAGNAGVGLQLHFSGHHDEDVLQACRQSQVMRRSCPQPCRDIIIWLWRWKAGRASDDKPWPDSDPGICLDSL